MGLARAGALEYTLLQSPVEVTTKRQPRARIASTWLVALSLAACAGDPQPIPETGDADDRFWMSTPTPLTSEDTTPADGFGSVLALSGDTALVGAPYRGAAYVFERTPDGWQQQAKLPSEGTKKGDGFGYSVAIDGDTALVGAWDAEAKTASVWVFVRTGTDWAEQGRLTTSDASSYTTFAGALAISGDTAIVGASGYESSSGAAYVFRRSGTEWAQEERLLAPDAAGEGEKFGAAVAISGDSVVIGAPDDRFSGFFIGTAYVFSRTEEEGWKHEVQLFPRDGDHHDKFGEAVAIDGNTVLVGAYGKDDYVGSAYVFERGPEKWEQQTRLTASDAGEPGKSESKDRFGLAVALSGDIAVIGADLDDGEFRQEDAGSAYVFMRTEGKWTEESKLIQTESAANDHYGTKVAVSGTMALIGSSPSDRFTPQEQWRLGVVEAIELGRDSDDDRLLDSLDNCALTPNPEQENLDGDELGDACDKDDDNDGTPDEVDNCREIENPQQKNSDGDLLGDLCDDDDDGDGVKDEDDNCHFQPNSEQVDADGNGVGDACEDVDGDGVSLLADNCPDHPNPGQEDGDNNGIGDACDDLDEDSVSGVDDNCPSAANPEQKDLDGDGLGDACDSDFDGDGVLNEDDNCPRTPNADQKDVCQTVYGCAAAGGRSSGAQLWMLALLALVLRRRGARRKRHRGR